MRTRPPFCGLVFRFSVEAVVVAIANHVNRVSVVALVRLCSLPGAEIRLVHQYTEFPELTSIHVNRTNELMLCSGYASHVHVYDVATGDLLRKYENIHSKHINITRFSNLTPSLFASSSFDRSAKVWDTRLRGNQPIYECR
jgi:WD40 repeat protein